MGHGSYSCKACYASWWCSKCHYSISSDLVDGIHVCQPADVLAKRKEASDDEMGVMDDPYEYVKKLRAEINNLKAQLAAQ